MEVNFVGQQKNHLIKSYTTRKLQITNKIFSQYVNTNSVKNTITDGITNEIMLSKNISSVIFILSVNLSVV